MAYEMFLLAVPNGADVEESGEALLVLLARGNARVRLTPSGRARADEISKKLREVEPDLASAPDGTEMLPGTMELRARSGLVVTIAERFARFIVPFAHEGEAAADTFRRLFALLSLAAQTTGWRPYDPQEGEPVTLDDATCESVLEIYLTVMDQLRPAGPVSG